MVGRPLRLCQSDQEAHTDGSDREALPDVQEWSRGPIEGPGVVERPSRMVGSHSRMTGSGREDILNVRQWSRGPHESPGVFARPARMPGSGR